MAWDHLDIDKPHLAYMILGGFTSLFMLCSLLVKEKLYIGEATVATICGVIFGPHAADLFNPLSWGNTDKITLECSRIVLVVQCFAVGVELPKNYMERHWKSVVLLLLPVMTYGWLITSLFIWWMFPGLSWLESLACAACVTATDPVLASSVVGKGKFAKRVPKHLRDLLSAESGCNDGMAFPFIYFATYLIAFKPHGEEFALHWVCYTILYECIFGAIFGFAIGYFGRHAIKYAEKKGLIDRESFLVFYFVLALFCAGSGSLLGMDDLLIGFSAGVGFSNDGWFTEKTEESHVSNVIDLLLNLAYFVYFGSIIPWDQYNAPDLGLVPWRLVVLAILVIFFRRIPIMLTLKAIIPDVKTWREALFAGHFGPIGVGAIFAAILTRAELEHESTQPLDILPGPGEHNYLVVTLIWPITTFLVISSIIVHGSSIAVFTLGKRINTLTITMSYTQANEEGPSWMNRLPRVQSTAKSSMSLRKADSTEMASDLPEYPPGTLPPIGAPGNFLRRQREDDRASDAGSRPASLRSSSKPRRRKWGKDGAGGPVSQSAIAPQRRPEIEVTSPSEGEPEPEPEQPQFEVYQEGHKVVIEDKEGNVLKTDDMEAKPSEEPSTTEEENQPESSSPDIPKPDDEPAAAASEADKGKGGRYQNIKKQFGAWAGFGKEKEKEAMHELSQKDRTRRSAHAYQFGNTIIVEDEDGEVVRKYDIPPPERPRKGTEAAADSSAAGPAEGPHPMRRRLSRMGTWVGKDGETSGMAAKKSTSTGPDEDEGLRFTVKGGAAQAARRMSKQDFIKQIQKLDPKAHHEISEEPEESQTAAKSATAPRKQQQRAEHSGTTAVSTGPDTSREGQAPPSSEIPTHDVAASLAKYIPGHEASAASARRRRFSADEGEGLGQQQGYEDTDDDSEDDGTERIPPSQLRRIQSKDKPAPTPTSTGVGADAGETPAERRRRLAVLGELERGGDAAADDDDDDDDDEEAATRRARAAVQEPLMDDDSEDDGEPRAVKGKVQFADGTKPARRKEDVGVSGSGSGAGAGGDGNGNGGGEGGSESGGNGGNGGKGHRPRISWA
ncbi:hypothetical protein FQN54_006992 [Arachnomyces sp. PD_36]|nr:hypothetical protein FQN54_006992 [Arachnomyces sp. PD_36]